MDKSSYKFKLNFTAITIMILHSHVNICEGFVGVWKTGGKVGQRYPEEQTGCVEDWRESGTRAPRRTNRVCGRLAGEWDKGTQENKLGVWKTGGRVGQGHPGEQTPLFSLVTT